MKIRLFTLSVVVLALAAGMTGLAVAVRGNELAAQNSAALRTLLLDGKTASAISAKKTGVEVRTLLDLQAFDHAQTVKGTQTLRHVILQIERHLDATILRDVNRAATRVQHAFGR